MKPNPRLFGSLLLIAFGILLVASVLPAHVIAQSPPPSFPLKDLKFNQVLTILNTLVTWIFTIFLITAVIFVIIAAFHFLVSGTNPQGVKKATHMLVYAAIAIAVALLSVGTRSLVEQLVTGQGQPPPGPSCGNNPLAPGCGGYGP